MLAGATMIAVMLDNRDGAESTVPAVQTQSVPGSTSPAINGESPKINPAHGQPGHRCDLAVGAPLDGSGTTTTPLEVTTPSVQPQPQQTAPAPAGLKINPPHGQPGHRCDLQVGAPLT